MPVAYTPPAAPARAHIPATALFVQAGSFSVYENAAKLKDRLAWIAPAQIETTTVRGKTFYRVKLGPVNDVAQADSVLAKVIDSGEAGARIIR